ncbi:mitochondrial carrier homolog 2 [Drosophila navojoa]|nr:mitochondrial carrier homolog 2 [Drosophila navojoa]
MAMDDCDIDVFGPRIEGGAALLANRELAVALRADGDEAEEENRALDCVETVRAKPNEFWRFMLRMSLGAVMHPYEYAKILMQLGFEPMPAVISTNWLGRTTLFLPSANHYLRYIRQIDGVPGLYRGLIARVMGSTVYAAFSGSLVNLLGWRHLETQTHPFRNYLCNMLRDALILTTGLAISHPFYVISVRQMAQFVGREVIYSSLKGSVEEILQQAGPLGLYVGFVPRLLSDLGVLFCTSTLSALCARFGLFNSRRREYNSVLIQFGAVMLFYPLQVVGACMACSGSAVAAGAPPYMPVYGQWVDCLSDLVVRGDHYRGAFMFRRVLSKVQVQRSRDPFTVSRLM